MRTRLAITTTLVLGLLLSTAGAGLAVSGISGTGSSGEAQYPQDELPSGGVLGEEDTGGGPTGKEAPTEEAQPNRQVTQEEEDNLPFTGLAAVPLLLAGVGLIGSGIVLRRGARREPAH